MDCSENQIASIARSTWDRTREAAAGGWPGILVGLGIPAEALDGRHHPCPGCGGRDRFRFDDLDGSGSWLCGGGGELKAGDGFALLTHARGLEPLEALRAVARYLGIDDSPAPRRAPQGPDPAARRARIERAVLVEVDILRDILRARADAPYLIANRRFRLVRPEWMPPPMDPWEREVLAARRVQRGLGELYGL